MGNFPNHKNLRQPILIIKTADGGFPSASLKIEKRIHRIFSTYHFNI